VASWKTGEVEPGRGDIDFAAVDFVDAALKTTGVDGAAEWPRGGVLVDARAGERFAVAGIDATQFPGSWSEWTSCPDRPGAVGSR